MALYEYKCADCEERFDLMRPMSAADDVASGVQLRRLAACDLQLRLHNSRRLFLSTNPVMDARMASGAGGGCCGGGCGCG